MTNTNIEKIKKFFLTWGFVFFGVTIFLIVMKGCVSGCASSIGKRGIERTYKLGFPVYLIEGQPSAIYKASKINTMYRIFANKPFYIIDEDGDLIERDAGCAVWISGKWLVAQAKHSGTIITKIEEGSCKEFKNM